MATANAGVPKRSVAEEKFWNLLPYPKTPDSDNTLCVLAEVCSSEAEAAAKAAAPDQYCFGVMATVRGRWAAHAAADPRMTMELYPKTKKRLCNYVADGWLGTRERTEEAFFADVLRQWPAAEAKQAADVVRQIIEFRSNGEGKLLKRMGRFFIAPLSVVEEGSDEIPRTILKAIAKYAEPEDFALMGQAFHALQAGQAAPLRSFMGALQAS